MSDMLLIFPDPADSVSATSLRPDIGEIQTEHQPTTSHEDDWNSSPFLFKAECMNYFHEGIVLQNLIKDDKESGA